ncbi:nucleoside triphosphate pyrophosphohydrolase [Novosphingobium sp.]|uniref:nucleoside triphosphate pyrophosphohydrolase n=1 Tax=Novosphingobium sp. TaxID=1874826 RepID=UPI003C7CE3F7
MDDGQSREDRWEQLKASERQAKWDLAQSFATIAPYTIEEAYEVADAIERSDMAALKDELGDLLLQVVFHARIAEEAGLFAFGDVAGATSALDGVALALPALMRAEKLQKRAARQGFDWPDTAGPAAKLAEEAEELAQAGTDKERAEEAGDLLFAAVNVARSYGIAPEEALRAANAKFERRFKAMEALAAARGVEFTALNLDQQEELWQAVKASESGKPA